MIDVPFKLTNRKNIIIRQQFCVEITDGIDT